MTLKQSGPTIDAMREILRRVCQDLDKDDLGRTDLLQIEMTLRGMLPDLETRLQVAVEDNQERTTVDRAVQGLMALSANLMWIQLHARSDLDILRDHLRDAIRGADQALQPLTQPAHK
jgi:hypothetical protein